MPIASVDQQAASDSAAATRSTLSSSSTDEMSIGPSSTALGCDGDLCAPTTSSSRTKERARDAFLAAICNRSVRSEHGLVEIQEMISNSRALVRIGNRNGVLPLHCAARNNDVEVIKLLLSARANVNLADYHGCTPLHHAVRNARPEPAAIERRAHTLRILRKAGGDINSPSFRIPRPSECTQPFALWALTPLETAVLYRQPDEIIGLLQRLGASYRREPITRAPPLTKMQLRAPIKSRFVSPAREELERVRDVFDIAPYADRKLVARQFCQDRFAERSTLLRMVQRFPELAQKRAASIVETALQCSWYPQEFVAALCLHLSASRNRNAADGQPRQRACSSPVASRLIPPRSFVDLPRNSPVVSAAILVPSIVSIGPSYLAVNAASLWRRKAENIADIVLCDLGAFQNLPTSGGDRNDLCKAILQSPAIVGAFPA